jgi:hypothetical protein
MKKMTEEVVLAFNNLNGNSHFEVLKKHWAESLQELYEISDNASTSDDLLRSQGACREIRTWLNNAEAALAVMKRSEKNKGARESSWS